MATKTAAYVRDAALDAAIAPLFSGGELRIYSGEQPASPSDAPTGKLLAALGFDTPAFNPARDGVIVSQPLQSAEAIASGFASWCRCVDVDGEPLIDGDVRNSGAFLNLSTLEIQDGARISCNAVTLSLPL